MHSRRIALSVLALLALAACGPAPQTAPRPTPEPTAAPAEPTAAPAQVELVVFAAASLTEAFTEIGGLHEAANPGVTAAFNFGASNQLAEQINQGAPADVFASANARQMEAIVEGGRIDPAAPQTFARNRLLVIFPKDNPGGIAELQDLGTPGLKLVLAAAEVPVGEYSIDFLDKAAQDPAFGAAYKDEVLANVVSYEENVRAVFSKVALGEADAGIVYSSDIAGAGAEDVASLDIPDELNTIAAYPIAAVNDSLNAAAAQGFVELVLGPEGQDVLLKYGFAPASGS
jgi:molybdate transport system substrate-binding protein